MGIGSHTRPNNGATNSWITPREIIDDLGPFDLDPCMCFAQPWWCAAKGFSEFEDGLWAPWRGLVWLNPPYGTRTTIWLDKLANHNNGIALVFARTETAMFVDHVWRRANALKFLWGRLHFHYPSGRRASGNSGGPSVLCAYGAEAMRRLDRSSLPGAVVRVSRTADGESEEREG